MGKNLIFKAGKNAFDLIQQGGLHPDMVQTVAGAAGGPKWLVLSPLDRILFSSWFQSRTEPLHLIGSSIGAWRFAALSQPNPIQAIDRFQEAYLAQSYSAKPTPAEVSRESKRIQDAFVTDQAVDEIIQNPVMKLNVMAVRCRWPVSSENKALLVSGLALAAGANLVKRRSLNLFFERTLFYSPGSGAFYRHSPAFKPARVSLTRSNLKSALLASGSIPLVMSGVRAINGSKKGTYRDGGILDYHIDIPFKVQPSDKLVLFPHYLDRVIPGWLDKKLAWRKPGGDNMSNVLLVGPSRAFVDSLPLHKIPDRNDFWTFAQKDAERIHYWNTVIERSRVLADEFMEAVESSRIKKYLAPLEVSGA